MSSANSPRAESATLQRIHNGALHSLSMRCAHRVGAMPEAELRVPESPPVAAVIYWNGENWQVVDCGTLSTAVNGRSITIATLANGDLLTFANGPPWVFSDRSPPAAVHWPPVSIPRPAAIEVHEGSSLPPRVLVGTSPGIVELRSQIATLGNSSTQTLIVGEFGVGKRHLAHALHTSTARAPMLLVRVHCGAVTSAQIQDVLGPMLDGDGQQERPVGTVILEEVGSLTRESQAALLEVVRHVAERRRRRAYDRLPPRFISLSERDAAALGKDGPEQRELHSHLFVAQLFVEPLRARLEDLLPLAEHFHAGLAATPVEPEPVFPQSAISVLSSYDWPANLTELKLAIARGVALSRAARSRPNTFTWQSLLTPPTGYEGLSLEEVERRHILATLTSLNWTKSHAARVLEIERSTLDRKIRRFGIQRPSTR